MTGSGAGVLSAEEKDALFVDAVSELLLSARTIAIAPTITMVVMVAILVLVITFQLTTFSENLPNQSSSAQGTFSPS
jgi:hypothetical protein